MRNPASLLSMLILTTALGAVAADKGGSPVLSEAERARVKAQVESLQKSKIQQAQTSNQVVKDSALRKGQAIDEKTQRTKDLVDRTADEMSWRYGSDLSTAAGKAKKLQLDQQAKVEKEKIAAEARKKATAQMDAAKRSAEGVTQSVEGLKSQVSKKGQYGLQPKGSSLYVRSYGKSK